MFKMLAVLIVSLSTSAIAQKISEKQIRYQWVLSKGNFPDDSVSFRIIDPEKDSLWASYIYKFKKRSEIECGYLVPVTSTNTEYYVTHSKWKLNDNELTIDMKAGYATCGMNNVNYEMKIVYSIERVTNTEMVLKKEKEILNRKYESPTR